MDYYIGEIRLFASKVIPSGWQLCDGTSLLLSSYPALFSLIGTTYGGDGRSTFKVPNLIGRVPVHHGKGTAQDAQTHNIGQSAGAETVPLDTTELPPHTHSFFASTNPATSPAPISNTSVVAATSPNWTNYVNPGANPTASIQSTPMAPGEVGLTGNAIPHDNMMPSIALNYIIALDGIFPSQN